LASEEKGIQVQQYPWSC